MPNINAMQSSTDYDLIVGKSSAANNSTSSENFKETFSSILNREKAVVRETLEEMKERKELLDRVKSERETNETIKRIMPDGSIMITTVEGGKVTSTDKYKPSMQIVVDDAKPIPTDASGVEQMSRADTKLEPFHSVFDF